MKLSFNITAKALRPIAKPFEYLKSISIPLLYVAKIALDPPGRQIIWNLHKRYIQLPGKDKPPSSSCNGPSNGTLPTNKNKQKDALTW